MARSDVSVEDLRAFARDLISAGGVINRAADELEAAKLHSVLAHSAMIEKTHLPGVNAFASDVLSVAIQTAVGVQQRKDNAG